MSMDKDIERIIFGEDVISEQVKKAAEWLDERFAEYGSTPDKPATLPDKPAATPAFQHAATPALQTAQTLKAPPIAVAVLKGSAFFFCDLVRAMKTPVQVEFMTASSYGDGAVSSGTPKIKTNFSTPVEGRDVILVEDIIDSGRTLLALKELFKERGARSFTAVTLFDKPSRRVTPVQADFACFEVGDEFIVGYGLDYAQRYRNLPYAGILKREIYEK